MPLASGKAGAGAGEKPSLKIDLNADLPMNCRQGLMTSTQVNAAVSTPLGTGITSLKRVPGKSLQNSSNF